MEGIQVFKMRPSPTSFVPACCKSPDIFIIQGTPIQILITFTSVDTLP